MSLDTIAILDVATPLDPAVLLERVAADVALAALVPRFGPEWEPTEWTAVPSPVDDRDVDVIGPGGIVLRLGRRSVEVYHVLPFSSFAADGDDQRLVRRAIRSVARIVGSNRAVYTHELARTDRDPDAGTDVVVANLIAAVGRPSRSFAELAAAAPHRAGSWYVDTFADLGVN